MSLKIRPGPPEPGLRGILRAVALAALLAGTLGSVALTFYAGRTSSSNLLLSLFLIWVVSPFVGAVLARAVAKHWEAFARTTLYVVMLVVALGSLAIYGEVALGPPREQPAFFFLMVPLVSWLLIALAAAIGMLSTRKRGQAAAN
jgi:hypothetical protein